MKITRGGKSLEELLPFINKIFRKNFPRLLPKLYTTDEYLNDHYYATNDSGELIGALASIPSTLILGDSSLKGAGIGMVSCKKSARGQGVMSGLIKKAVADACDDGIDFMFLSGNRKRYEYFGFVPAGSVIKFTVTKENVKHYQPSEDYSFAKLTKEYYADAERIYNLQSGRYIRPDFIKSIHSWNAKNHYAILKDEKCIGYLTKKGLVIGEICLENADICDVICSFFNKISAIPLLYVHTYFTQLDFIKRLSSLAQYSDTNTNCCIRINNYKNVIQSCLAYCPPKIPFEITLEIESELKLLISSDGESISVRETDKKADIILTAEEATYALLNTTLSGLYRLPFSIALSVPPADNV